jgi:hypothetical protein
MMLSDGSRGKVILGFDRFPFKYTFHEQFRHGDKKHLLGRDDVIGIIYVSWVEAIHDPQGDWSVVH